MADKPTYEELEQRVKELEKGPDIKARFGDRLQTLSLAIEQSSEGIAVVDMDGNLEFLNDAFAQMHGYSSEELIGKNLSVFHALHQRPSVEEANREIKETGEFKGEIWHTRRDGTAFPTMMHNSIIRDNAGKPIGMMGALRDISDIKKAEEALGESEEKYRTLVETNPYGFQEIDPTGIITYTNATYQQMTGYTGDELYGESILNLLEPVTRRDEMREYLSILVKEQPQPTTYFQKLRTKDGRVIDIEVAWRYNRDHCCPVNFRAISTGYLITCPPTCNFA